MDFHMLLDQSHGLAKMVSRSEAAREYRLSKQALNQDEEAQSLIAKFTIMKEKYDEVQRFGKYHPDYQSVSKEIRLLKRELDFHEKIAAYKRAEKNLETLLIECSRIIAGSVSNQIIVPTGNPLLDARSCSGGCGSGGSCSCA